jgi:hypothetical protein
MPPESPEGLLARLEELKTCFGPADGARVEGLLDELAQARFEDAASLGRFHEALLFLRAHPHNPEIVRRTEQMLAWFGQRVGELRAAGADLTPLEEPEISGIAGTAFSAIFSYPVACHVASRHPAAVEIDWESYEDADRLGPSLPRWVPLLEEDALVEANVPYRAWVGAARGRARSDLVWLLGRVLLSPLSFAEKVDRYDSLRVPIRWELGEARATRTHTRLRARKIVYQQTPLIRRSEVSLASELASPPLPLRSVSRRQAEALLDLVRDTSALRYRELWGFTHGDPASILKAQAGRGVEIFFWGVPPPWRLPLRAYHAGFMVKNGVPVGYVETLSLFERSEVGYNVYYTFREGESAWLYGRVLRLLNQLLGVTCFSVDPYQIGHHNEEAIEAGAFWFYRKLGFRPMRPEPARRAEAETKKVQTRPGYRTPARILRRLAEGSMILEAPGVPVGAFDRFETRQLAQVAVRRMAERADGEAEAMREVAAALEVRPHHWSRNQQGAFWNLAPALALIPDLARWSEAEKRAVVRIIRAKAGPDEAPYLRLLQNHGRLRAAWLVLGS